MTITVLILWMESIRTLHERSYFITNFSSDYLRIIVLVLPHIVPFSFGDSAIYSGQATQVTCLVSEGDIPLEFNWSFEGSNANSLSEITTTKIGTKGSLLFIDSVTDDQAGNYTCTVSNRAGSVFYTATLNVYGIHILFYYRSWLMELLWKRRGMFFVNEQFFWIIQHKCK